jgi:hypothetical protein
MENFISALEPTPKERNTMERGEIPVTGAKEGMLGQIWKV